MKKIVIFRKIINNLNNYIKIIIVQIMGIPMLINVAKKILRFASKFANMMGILTWQGITSNLYTVEIYKAKMASRWIFAFSWSFREKNN